MKLGPYFGGYVHGPTVREIVGRGTTVPIGIIATGSPKELILDFGLNTHPIGNVSPPVKISERLVMNYYTAKRLWHTLGVSLQRHKQAFGVLETDIGKRVMPQRRTHR